MGKKLICAAAIGESSSPDKLGGLLGEPVELKLSFVRILIHEVERTRWWKPSVDSIMILLSRRIERLLEF